MLEGLTHLRIPTIGTPGLLAETHAGPARRLRKDETPEERFRARRAKRGRDIRRSVEMRSEVGTPNHAPVSWRASQYLS